MNIKPVEIDVPKLSDYCQIAFLVDRDDFLADLELVRHKLEIDSVPYYEIVETKKNRANSPVSKYFKAYQNGEIDLSTAIEIMRLFERQNYKSSVYSVFYLMEGIVPKLKNEVSFLLRKYKRESYFEAIFESCILNGFVKLQGLNTTHLVSNKFVEINQVAILLNPKTTFEEVRRIFKWGKILLDGKREYDKTKSELDSLDTISNIKRDRDWYWKHKNGLSYQQIWMGSKVGDKTEDREGVIKAVKQYERNLAVEI